MDVKLEVGRVEEAVLGARLPGGLDVIAVTVKPRNGKVHEKKNRKGPCGVGKQSLRDLQTLVNASGVSKREREEVGYRDAQNHQKRGKRKLFHFYLEHIKRTYIDQLQTNNDLISVYNGIMFHKILTYI